MPQMMTEEEYRAMLDEIEHLQNTVPDTEEGVKSAEGRRMMALVLEVVAYEEIHYPIPPPELGDDWR